MNLNAWLFKKQFGSLSSFPTFHQLPTIKLGWVLFVLKNLWGNNKEHYKMNKEDFAEADQNMQEQKNNEKWPHLWLAREECGLDVVGQCLGKPLNLPIMVPPSPESDKAELD